MISFLWKGCKNGQFRIYDEILNIFDQFCLTCCCIEVGVFDLEVTELTDMFTKGVLGLLGTFSRSCVAYNSAVGVLDRNRNPDLGLSNPDPESPFLNLLLVGAPPDPDPPGGNRPL